VVGDQGLILRSIDAGLTWATVSSGITEDLNDLLFFDDNTGLIVGDNGTIIRSIDAGLSWASVASGITEKLSSVSSADGSSNGIIGGDGQTILRSTDQGLSWIVVQSGFIGEFDGAHMANSSSGMVCGQNSIFQPLTGRTLDAGTSWTFSAFYLNGNEGEMNDIHTFDGNVAVGVSDLFDATGAISRTTNGGTDWVTTPLAEGLDGVTFATVAAGFVVGGSGTILKSIDGGLTWSEQVSGTTENLREVFLLDPLQGYAVGDNGVIVKTTTGGVVTSVEPITHLVPEELRLYQNYPNPFNPTTLIEFSLPTSGRVTIELYDVLGKKIRKIVDSDYGRGTHAVNFRGEGLPSGTYFYKLEAGGLVRVKAMLLLR